MVFIIAGIAGFVVEYTLIYVGDTLLQLGPRQPRIVSFPLAVVVTWSINRFVGFQVTTPATFGEFAEYSAGMIGGGLINISVYLVLTYMAIHPLLALVVATATALVWNLLWMKRVFTRALR